MNIAILVCSEATSDMLEQWPNEGEKVIALFAPIRPDWSFTLVRAMEGELPASVHDHDAYIATGSPHSPNENESWIRKLEDFLRDVNAARMPFLGICFGHQLFLQALGAEVGTPPGVGDGTMILGVNEVEFDPFARTEWMEPWPLEENGRLTMYGAHSDQVLRLNGAAEIVAHAPACPIAATVCGNHALTIQYHPEIYRDFSVAQIRSQASSIGPDKARRALAEAERDTHGPLFAQWAARFLDRAMGTGEKLAA